MVPLTNDAKQRLDDLYPAHHPMMTLKKPDGHETYHRELWVNYQS